MTYVNYGKDVEYARSRLLNTFCLNPEGKYSEILDISSKGVMITYEILSSKEVHFDLEDFYFNPLKLGFVNNLYSYPCYTCRKPTRYYKQGLCHENLVFFGGQGVSLGSVYFAKMVENKYPSVLDCCDLLINNEKMRVAFCKDWSIQINKSGLLELVYRFYAEPVGICELNDNGQNINYTLYPKYSFLYEKLEESLRNVGK